jgi:uncharacterized membrane protein YecN with MAPEG domain
VFAAAACCCFWVVGTSLHVDIISASRRSLSTNAVPKASVHNPVRCAELLTDTDRRVARTHTQALEYIPAVSTNMLGGGLRMLIVLALAAFPKAVVENAVRCAVLLTDTDRRVARTHTQASEYIPAFCTNMLVEWLRRRRGRRRRR